MSCVVSGSDGHRVFCLLVFDPGRPSTRDMHTGFQSLWGGQLVTTDTSSTSVVWFRYGQGCHLLHNLMYYSYKDRLFQVRSEHKQLPKMGRLMFNGNID